MDLPIWQQEDIQASFNSMFNPIPQSDEHPTTAIAASQNSNAYLDFLSATR
jgi:hypothetical protein